MRGEVAFVVMVVGFASYALVSEYRLQRLRRRHAAEVTRLQRSLREHQRNLAQARCAEREAQQTTVRTKMLYDQAAAQRDCIAVDLAHLRDRYIEMAGQHRHLVVSRLADGLNRIKISRN